MRSRFNRYFNVLGNLPFMAIATDQNGQTMDLYQTIENLMRRVRETHNAGNKLMFVGNGGSAGICSHMAIDYSKNGGIRSTAFNDGAALTCLGNDLGYENVFAKQVELHGRPGDMLIAISSSGKSPNILRAVDTAREQEIFVLTLSGFSAENPLRMFGDINLFVNSSEYGFVEITHLALCHAILDLEMGWGNQGITAEEQRLGLDENTAAA